VAFGKPGRPPENREQRRLEIYTRAAPEILRQGEALTVREVARTACVSVGSFYRYFSGKRELLLYGLRPESQAFVCRPFGERHAALRRRDRARYLEAFLDHQVEMALFVRPSVRAAGDMGLRTLAAGVEATVNHAADEFAALLAEFVPGARRRELADLGRGVRRTVLGALFDPSISSRELKANLRALIEGTALAVRSRDSSDAVSPRSTSAQPRGAGVGART
jgi:AcrR family transcriptional regulator